MVRAGQEPRRFWSLKSRFLDVGPCALHWSLCFTPSTPPAPHPEVSLPPHLSPLPAFAWTTNWIGPSCPAHSHLPYPPKQGPWPAQEKGQTLHSNTCTYTCTHTNMHTPHTGTPPPGSSVSSLIIVSSLNESPADPMPSSTSLSGEAVTLENHCTFSSVDLTSRSLHSYKYLPISSPHTEYCGCNSLTPHSTVCSQILGSHPLIQGVGWETEA